MNAEEYKRVMTVIDAVMDASADDRQAVLQELCAGDDDLRLRAEELLAQNTAAESFMEELPAAAIAATAMIGRTIGSYRITGELGRGGMGAVYLAERSDGAFDQQVAIKLIKRGMDTDAIQRRFINERQILASLEHPNIAHLVDGGTTSDALPYFVLEYVDGESIVDFADSEDLDLEARLELFRKVCSAVSYAHQSLVIHRDLKPSNILVTKDGTPKLLDFGIAKLLNTDAADGQTTRNFVFTPEYASPEQVRGEKLTTATDIYSLGVILFELLTGSRPYRTSSNNISDVIRSICETEPERPSSVVSRPPTDTNGTGQSNVQTNARTKPQALRGDLDNIILKALRKEPERRYSSVEQFSDDIRRHLAGLPVLAAKDTWSYRASKFVSRNKGVALAAGVILVTLIAGLAATLYQARIAQRERIRAEQRFNDVRQLANSFLFEFHDAIQSLSGSTPARKLVVTRAVEYLDKLAAESEGDPTLQRELATAYERIGKIQGNSYFPNLGDTEGATRSYNRSLELRQQLADADPSNREIQYELAIGHRGVGDMFYTVNDLQAGFRSYENALSILEQVVAAEPANLKYRSSYADVWTRRGDILGMEGFANLGDTAGAVESYRRAVTLAESLVADAPTRDEYKGDYATRLFFLARLESAIGNWKAAVASGQKSIEILESLTLTNPDDAAYRIRWMNAINSHRLPLLNEGLTNEAIENTNKVIGVIARESAADPENVHLRRSLGVAYNSLGICLLQAKDPRGALDNFRRAIATAEALAAADPKNLEHRQDVAFTKQQLAEAQLELGDLDAALANLNQVVTSLEADTEKGNLRAKQDLAAALTQTGKVLMKKGSLNESARNFRRAIELGHEHLQKNPNNIGFKTRHALALFEAGKAYAALGKNKDQALLTESCDALSQSFAILNELQEAGKLAAIYADRPGIVSNELGPCGRA